MSQKEEVKSRNKWAFAFVALVAVLAIVYGTKTAIALTDTPAFCGSCHLTNEAVRTHAVSTHATLNCNDCHAPHNILAKIPFKAKTGFSDIYVNTFGDPPTVLKASKGAKDVINQNCQSCHTMTTMNVAMDAKEYCTDCHISVPHSGRTPISERMVAGE